MLGEYFFKDKSTVRVEELLELKLLDLISGQYRFPQKSLLLFGGKSRTIVGFNLIKAGIGGLGTPRGSLSLTAVLLSL